VKIFNQQEKLLKIKKISLNKFKLL